jgi:uncharacterized radical SAM superfamily protein|uniref:Radical SAM protein n=1 Tax=candidate division WOR-3 bacterium TaxID=2052148 RepID=A0A7C4XVD3_UNCW3
MNNLKIKAKEARELSYHYHGKNVTFYIPGMFYYNNERGRFPAISITGKKCPLNCDHCQGKLLESMLPVNNPDDLLNTCEMLYKNGNHGFLLSGGFDFDYALPVKKYLPVIKKIKDKTKLKITIHCGIVDYETARALKEAGIDQALIDVIGDDKALKKIYKTRKKTMDIIDSIKNLLEVGVDVIPHIVIGIDYGRIGGEYRGVDLVTELPIKTLVFVSLMPLPDTPMERIKTPSAEEIAEILIYARFKKPELIMALGCARKRGYTDIDLWALECGINRIALPAEEVVKKAEDYGLNIKWEKICCSL